MKTYELHEYAEIFPPMSETELEQLEEDIKANGLHHGIILYQGKILDGRHRYEICKKQGIKAIFEEYNGDDPLGYVVGANLCRRHMSDTQRAMVAARLKEKGWLSANLRSEKKSEQAAAALNVKPRTVESAANVLKSGIPALVDAVSSGEVSVSAGEIVAKMPAEQQARIVASGKDAIVEAASQTRNARKSPLNKLATGVGTSQVNEQQSTVEEAAPVSPYDGSGIEGTATTTQSQLVNFIRQALETGATWLIAGKGKLPELQTDWLVHKVCDEDPLNVSEEKCDHEQEESADQVRNPTGVTAAGEPKIDANPEAPIVQLPKGKPQVDPALKEALIRAADEYFRVEKDESRQDYYAMKAAQNRAVNYYVAIKGVNPPGRHSVYISKWRRMGWWPQTQTYRKEREQFFSTIRERLETGNRLKYDPAKNSRRRKTNTELTPERT